MYNVWVNGTFDVIHRGHVQLLKFAAKHGKVRVGIDTDKRVQQFKGNSRPINTLDDRMLLIKSLKFVDSVVSFDSDDELTKQIQLWNPHYLIIGSDYRDKKIIGAEYAKNIVIFDRIEGYSSTNIIKLVSQQ